MVGGVKWIIANFKSNKSIKEALEWVDYVGPMLERRENIKVVVCPVILDVEEVKKAVLVGSYPLIVGSQDLSPFDTGSFTGEEPARLLKEVIDFTILGHSERRQNLGETDQMIAKKVKEAKVNNITTLICVQGVDTPIPEGVDLVAYEPIFAIGTGSPDTPENANLVAETVNSKYDRILPILYGGSVTSKNAKAYLDQPNLSGLLVGKASLDPEEFLRIVNASYRC